MREVFLDQLIDTEDLSYYNNTPYTGSAISYHPNKRLKYKVNFVNGLKDGEFIIHRENGKLFSSHIYKNDKRNGEHKRYDNKGSLILEHGMYLDDLKTGDWIKYFENGMVETKQSFVDDKENGVYETYYLSGQLKAKGNFENGVKSGLWEYYYESGNLKGTEDHPGLQLLYNEDGSLKSRIDIDERGICIGRYIFNLDDGSPYIKGFRNKESKEYEGLFFKYREDSKMLNSIEFYNNGNKEFTAYNFNKLGKVGTVLFYSENKEVAKLTSAKKLEEFVSNSNNKFVSRIVLDFDFNKQSTLVYLVDRDKNIFKYENSQLTSLSIDEKLIKHIESCQFMVLEKNLYLSFYMQEDHLIDNYIEIFDRTAQLLWIK
jgi:antitoxin component YwqK of YwqJK toxin-antitoxin module